jgi:DNA-binding MarR family transcriptional regulator
MLHEPPMTAGPAYLPLEDHLCFAVYAAGHAFTTAYKPLLEPLGLTYPQYLVLIVLWERDGRTLKEIGARLHLDSGTLTPLLKRLEAAGFVRRRRDVADERQLRVELTEKGRATQGEAASIRESLQCTLGVSVEALQALQRDLAALTPRLRGIPPTDGEHPKKA